MDKEFDTVADQCSTLPVNTTAANKQIPEIERTMRLVKEKECGIVNALICTRLPNLITIKLVNL